jgi:hypothetical protein
MSMHVTPSSCSFVRATGCTDNTRSMYPTLKYSVSALSLYSSATSTSQSTKMPRITALTSFCVVDA